MVVGHIRSLTVTGLRTAFEKPSLNLYHTLPSCFVGGGTAEDPAAVAVASAVGAVAAGVWIWMGRPKKSRGTFSDFSSSEALILTGESFWESWLKGLYSLQWEKG